MTDTPKDPEKDAFQRQCSIIISMIASMLAVTGLGSQNATFDASFLNASSINGYAFYQARNIRQNDMLLTAQTLEGLADTAAPAAPASVRQGLREQADALREKARALESNPVSGEGKEQLLAKARAAEKQRDLALQKVPYFDFAELLLQLSIILMSVVLITERRTLYVSGLLAAGVGTLLSMNGFFMFMPIPLLS